MSSPNPRKIAIIAVLTLLLIVWSARETSGVTIVRPDPAALPPAATEMQARERLLRGFEEILDFFARREFSLLAAWHEMRSSGDPHFFEKRYPEISRELDTWGTALESRLGIPSTAEQQLDLDFVVERLGGLVSDPRVPDVTRDNALAAVCMVCVMEGLRCDAARFHRFLAIVVAEDSSAMRKAEALRWWRRSDGVIDERLLEEVLGSSSGSNLDLRGEVARVLFSTGTRRSLQAQRLLISTRGLPEDPSGGTPQIACTAIRHLGRARFEEAAPDLIGALADPSREVRACAAESMAHMSGQSPRFDPDAGPASNQEAIARWQAWWSARPQAPRASGAGGGR